MKPEYWDVTDEQVVEKTGQNLNHWQQVLDSFGAAGKKTNDVVAMLQSEHGILRYWARTLTTNYLKSKVVSK